MTTIFKRLIYLALLFAPFTVNSAAILSTNGHYYEVFSGSYTWDSANAEASSRSYLGRQGHLATITSASENLWIVQNLENYEGNFLGGFDSGTEGTWEWVTGEAFSFNDWEPGEPNSWNALNEDYLMYWWANENTYASWNDTTQDPNSDVGFELGYIVEYEYENVPAAVPLPAAVWLFGSAFLGIFGLSRRKKA